MSKALITNWSRAEMSAYTHDRTRRADAGETMEDADYILNYHDVTAAYRDITPERFRLLQTLQRLGAVSIHVLARELGRDYHNVHSDVTALLELNLVSRTPEGVSVPWDAVEWRLSTVTKAA
jgi:predicted transcriptional regulator